MLSSRKYRSLPPRCQLVAVCFSLALLHDGFFLAVRCFTIQNTVHTHDIICVFAFDHFRINLTVAEGLSRFFQRFVQILIIRAKGSFGCSQIYFIGTVFCSIGSILCGVRSSFLGSSLSIQLIVNLCPQIGKICRCRIFGCIQPIQKGLRDLFFSAFSSSVSSTVSLFSSVSVPSVDTCT